MSNKQPLTTNLLRLSEDKRELLLLITPVEDDVTVDSLLALFHQSEYTQFKPNIESINKAVQSFVRLNIQTERNADLESVMIAERLDAQMTITLGPQNMSAKALLTSAYGGNAITYEQLKTEIATLDICEGIIEKTILLLIKKSANAAPGSNFQGTIAKGKQPVHGSDAIFERLVETPNERLRRPVKNEDGTVDMRNLGELLTVKQGEPLMRRIPPVIGSDGISVTGDYIEHNEGKDFKLEVGKNTELSASDENLLIATTSGIPKTLNNGMQVDDVLLINEVNVGYGHVSYEGSIIIQGDICDSMKVKATGDITVSGFIDSANVECDGDLNVGNGIIGHKVKEGESFSCEVNCKGNVTANFSQYTKINAGLEVNIKKQLLHCEVNSGGNINVIDDTGTKGIILGGNLSTKKGVNTVTLGASAGSKTHIDLIGNYPALMENKKKLFYTINLEKEKLGSLIEAQRKIDQLPNSDKKQSLDARLTLTKEQVKDQLNQLSSHLNVNKAELQTYFEEAKVVTQKEMFNDVSIAIGKEKFRSLRYYGPTRVNIINYKLRAIPYLK